MTSIAVTHTRLVTQARRDASADRKFRTLVVLAAFIVLVSLIDAASDITDIENVLSALLAPVVSRDEDRVAVVVNYDNFNILPALIDDYSTMVQRLAARFYGQVTRYGTGGFLKARLEAK